MIEIASLGAFATIQDGGRPGRMHEGIPPGGALVPELLARANAAVENSAGEAGIEAVGAVTLVAHAPVLVSDGQAPAVRLLAGETHTFGAPGGLFHYVAVRGGIDVPRVLGGRGTLLVAGFGGYGGRPLRRGDRLAVGLAPPQRAALPPLPDRLKPIRVVTGPDVDRFEPRVFDLLFGSTFTIDVRSDRVGTRLAGPRLTALDGATALSSPMVRGAIQVPPSGEPIVLGPDHPTTGGYPVVATVIRAHLGSLAARPVGAPVRFER